MSETELPHSSLEEPVESLERRVFRDLAPAVPCSLAAKIMDCAPATSRDRMDETGLSAPMANMQLVAPPPGLAGAVARAAGAPLSQQL